MEILSERQEPKCGWSSKGLCLESVTPGEVVLGDGESLCGRA